MKRKALIVATLLVSFATVAGTIARRDRTQVLAQAAQGGRTLVYFTRHAEDDTALVESEDGAFLADCVPFLDDGEPGECCRDVLNALGELRASELARWFREKVGSENITHVIASHKIRTLQTVREIASDAGLSGDDDLNPGDGVQQIPPLVGECDEGFESASASRNPMIREIAALPLGSVAVVGAHSGTLYPIMEAFGIDTTDPVNFPRNPNSKVRGFNNLWIVSLDERGLGRLKKHLLLDLRLVRTRPEQDDDDDQVR